MTTTLSQSRLTARYRALAQALGGEAIKELGRLLQEVQTDTLRDAEAAARTIAKREARRQS